MLPLEAMYRASSRIVPPVIPAKFNSEFDKLRKLHKKTIDSYEEYMNREVILEMNSIHLGLLPKDISGEQMQIIADFVQ